MKLTQFDEHAKCPLDGVRILDLSRVVAGNMVSTVLADFGAEVIKVESPDGDALREWRVDGISTYWKVYGRNKKSLCVDLRSDEGRRIVLTLVERSHVFIENFRPGTLERMGLGPDLLLARNPELVILRISGWGQIGPYKNKPGFGTLAEGMSGFAAMNGFDDREPVLPPIQLADSTAGLCGAIAVMIALRHVEVSGGAGQVIDLTLFDPLFSILGPQAANYKVSGKVRPRTGSRSTTAAPRNAYKTKDEKWVCLSASTQAMAERLLRVIGRSDLIDHPHFKTNSDRVQHAQELDVIVGSFIGQRTLEENCALFDKAEVTVGPIYDISQLIDDPYVTAREVIVELPDADMGSIPMHNVVPRLSDTPGAIRRPAPSLGEHNNEILDLLGYAAERISKLKAEGVILSGRAGEHAS
jgi:formyl-CoA transferase